MKCQTFVRSMNSREGSQIMTEQVRHLPYQFTAGARGVVSDVPKLPHGSQLGKATNYRRGAQPAVMVNMMLRPGSRFSRSFGLCT